MLITESEELVNQSFNMVTAGKTEATNREEITPPCPTETTKAIKMTHVITAVNTAITRRIARQSQAPMLNPVKLGRIETKAIRTKLNSDLKFTW